MQSGQQSFQQRCCTIYAPLLGLLIVLVFFNEIREYGNTHHEVKDRSAASSVPLPEDATSRWVWGTLRPFPYVGLRCQSPQSPLVGIMWYRPSLLLKDTDLDTHSKMHSWESILRHECAYKDRLDKFGWNRHNGDSYGSQLIVDRVNHVNLTIDWVLIEKATSHWALRIHGEESSSQNESRRETSSDLSLLVYLSTPGNFTATVTSQNHIVGSHPDPDGGQLRPYRLWLSTAAPNHHPTYRNAQTNTSVNYNASSYFLMTHVDPAIYYNPKPNVMAELQDPTSSLPPHLFDPRSLYRADTVRTGNQGVLQVFYELPFTVDVHFVYDEKNHQYQDSSTDRRNGRQRPTVPESNESQTVTAALLRAVEQWDLRFRTTLNVSAAWSPDELETAQYALGNMLGSLTYMHGDRQLLETETVVSSKSQSTLLAIVPDRPNHAQGFFWDEGFHQHLVSLWDEKLTFAIVQSWLAQMDAKDGGWIARQQMLGNEIRWGARPTSWPQVPGTANPPSLHLLIETLLNRHQAATGEACPAVDSSLGIFLAEIADPLLLNIRWYLRTQTSEVGPNLFRWAGRTGSYCLPSGMDDYPRAPVLTSKEAHLDLQVWMIMSVRTGARVCHCVGMHDTADEFSNRHDDYQRSLMRNFWNDETGLFDEFWYDDRGDKHWNGHVGYLNFWPLFLNAVDTKSASFERLTTKLLDENNGIWSDYGLRSLSQKDSYYQKGDNYWTGPIWININFLAVSSLYRYSSRPDLYPMRKGLRSEIQMAYTKLRKNLIRTVVTSYTKTGFIWEVYSGDNGAGFNNHPFTGWSALIVNILAEMY